MAYKNALWISTAFFLPIDSRRLEQSHLYVNFLLRYKIVRSYNPDAVYGNPRYVFDNPYNIVIGAFVCAAAEADGVPEKHSIKSHEALKTLLSLLCGLLESNPVTMPQNVMEGVRLLGLVKM